MQTKHMSQWLGRHRLAEGSKQSGYDVHWLVPDASAQHAGHALTV
jgi:hypothetical protein